MVLIIGIIDRLGHLACRSPRCGPGALAMRGSVAPGPLARVETLSRRRPRNAHYRRYRDEDGATASTASAYGSRLVAVASPCHPTQRGQRQLGFHLGHG